MKKMLSFIVLSFLSFSLFAQTISLVENKTTPQSLLNTITFDAPESITKTTGEPFDKGFFMDLLVGVGSKTFSASALNNGGGFGFLSAASIASTSIRLGSKWYFGSGEKFKPGIQVVWARLGVIAPYGGIFNQSGLVHSPSLMFAPVNIGSTNLIMFSDVIGLEANFNIGLNSQFTFAAASASINQTLMEFGVLINPVVKFRYKKLAAGIDFTYVLSPGPGALFQSAQSAASFPYQSGLLLVSLTVGLKF